MSACPLCGGAAATAFVTTDRNRAVAADRFEYRRCGQCGTYFLANVPVDLARWYPGDYFIFPTLPELDRMARYERYKIEALRPYVRAGRLIEIGPGFGAFARIAALEGFEVCGIDMDGRCCDHLRLAVGVEAVKTDVPEQALADLPASDAIVLWHCLEHLRDPWAALTAAARNLRPGGVFAAALPNPQALQFRLLKGRWPHVDAPRHLYLIPARTLVERAAAEGLDLLALTSDDAGARHWNMFGWGRSFLPPVSGRVLPIVAAGLGRGMALAAAPLERRELRGSAYTIVLRKRA
jgi:SAM-dependent methyltransferase